MRIFGEAVKRSLTHRRAWGPRGQLEVRCLSAEGSTRLSVSSTPGNPTIRGTNLAPLCTPRPQHSVLPVLSGGNKRWEGRDAAGEAGPSSPAGPQHLYPSQRRLQSCFELRGDGRAPVLPRK